MTTMRYHTAECGPHYLKPDRPHGMMTIGCHSDDLKNAQGVGEDPHQRETDAAAGVVAGGYEIRKGA